MRSAHAPPEINKKHEQKEHNLRDDVASASQFASEYSSCLE